VAPTLLLLHGLSANGGVWAELESHLESDWDGRRSAPDLPGHGTAPRIPHYSFGSLAAAVAADLESGEPVVVIGHSLGGVVGLELAGGAYGVDVRGVVALGVKVAWTEDELANARSGSSLARSSSTLWPAAVSCSRAQDAVSGAAARLKWPTERPRAGEGGSARAP
jgi:pimeloyl-ACP methyl ester carboxylesterase